jgi:hypothetical protein
VKINYFEKERKKSNILQNDEKVYKRTEWPGVNAQWNENRE